MKITAIVKRAFKKQKRSGKQKELLSLVTQEILNPLTILSMNLSRVILQYRKNPDLRVQEIIPLIEKSEQHILRIKDASYAITKLIQKKY